MEKELGNHANKKTRVKCIKCKWKKNSIDLGFYNQ